MMWLWNEHRRTLWASDRGIIKSRHLSLAAEVKVWFIAALPIPNVNNPPLPKCTFWSSISIYTKTVYVLDLVATTISLEFGGRAALYMETKGRFTLRWRRPLVGQECLAKTWLFEANGGCAGEELKAIKYFLNWVGPTPKSATTQAAMSFYHPWEKFTTIVFFT